VRGFGDDLGVQSQVMERVRVFHNVN